MNTEEKQLLLIDLCARLPYGVMIKDTYSGHYGRLVEIGNRFAYFISKLNSNTLDAQLYYAKPYLRPMSSMTEEERREFSIFIGKTEVYVQQIRLDADSMINPIIGGYKCVYWGLFDKCIDWLNKKMFDYRGLIPMGLALEAPEGMYKTE